MLRGVHRLRTAATSELDAGRGLVVGDEDGLDRVVLVGLERGLELGRGRAGAPGAR